MLQPCGYRWLFEEKRWAFKLNELHCQCDKAQHLGLEKEEIQRSREIDKYIPKVHKVDCLEHHIKDKQNLKQIYEIINSADC